MEPYVVDFYCPQAKLIVEVDGEFHGERQVEDARRTATLESRGYRVIRFQATEVLVDLDGVLERLPPPRKGGGTSCRDRSVHQPLSFSLPALIHRHCPPGGRERKDVAGRNVL